jgi:hypothetical protein
MNLDIKSEEAHRLAQELTRITGESELRAAIRWTVSRPLLLHIMPAIGPLDMSKMDPLSAHDACVTAIQPRDKSISVGWDAVKKGWETLPNVWSELKITRMDLIFTSMAMWLGRRESRTP